MDDDRGRRAHELSKAAVGLPPAERERFLDEACGDDRALRDEVESVLAALADTDDFLETSILVSASDDLEAALTRRTVGRRLGRYTIKSVIASGGMGTVFLAEQDHPHRTVALKVMRGGILSTSGMRRFQYESEVLARLSHPNIAQVYEAGTHEAGGAVVPYFAMEYVPNARSITEYAKSRRLGTRERLELFTKVCAAVGHGHQNGVIHRDLKPANVLVDPSTGEPKIIDFGIARSTDHDVAATTRRTDVGHLVGTLQYMSPEQCEADPEKLDTRTDVYALGVILYELLCGALPYDLSRQAVYEAARVIREEAPARPSSINPSLRGDLETITLKALEKERDRRYQSAAELARDIRRYLSDLPIEARPATVLYQVRMFARRNKAMCAAVACILFVLLAAVAASSTFAVRAEREAVRRRHSEQLALLARDAAREERDGMIWRSYVGCVAGAELAHREGHFHRMRALLERAPAAHRGWDWRYLRRLSEPSFRTLTGPDSLVNSIALAPGASRLAAGCGKPDMEIVVWDLETGEAKALRSHTRPVWSVDFDPTGERLLSGGHDGLVCLWALDDGAERRVIARLERPVNRVRFMPDGAHVMGASQDATIRLWRLQDGAEVAVIATPSGVTAADVSPDGARIAAGGSDGAVTLWSTATREQIGPPMEGADSRIQSIAFDRSGRRIAAVAREGAIMTWDTRTGDRRTLLSDLPYSVKDVTWDADGTLLVVAAQHGIIFVDAQTGAPVATFRGHERAVSSVVLGPDGRLHSGSWDGTVRIWDLTFEDDLEVLRGHERSVRSVVFSPDGSRIATGSGDGTIVIRDATTMERLAVLPAGGGVMALAFSPDGTLLLSGGSGQAIRVWEAATGRSLPGFELARGNVWSIAVSPDGRTLFTAGTDGRVRTWDLSTREALGVVGAHGARANCVALSADGSRVASASRDGTIKLFDTHGGEEIETKPDDVLDVFTVAFSPDGDLLASGSRDAVLHFWRSTTGEHLHSTYDHGRAITCLAFSPDGRRLAAGWWESTIGIFDVQTGELLTTLRGHEDTVWTIAFSPDGTRVASGSFDGTVRVWDVEPQSTRRRDRDQLIARYPAAADLVDRLAEVHDEMSDVAAALRDDGRLDPVLRQAALNVVLRRSAQTAVSDARAAPSPAVE